MLHKFLSVVLTFALLLPMVVGILPTTAKAEENACPVCAVCSGCKTDLCSQNHEPCTCQEGNQAIRIRINGKWYGWYLTAGQLDSAAQWISVPIDMTGITGGAVYPVSVSSNITSSGNMSDSGIDLYATPATENLESYLTHDRYCDGGWMAYSDRNVNVKIEGFDGHSWLDLSASEPVYAADGYTTVLGLFEDNQTYYNAARNIPLIEDLGNISAMRVSVQVHIGSNVKTLPDYAPESFAAFLPAQPVSHHTLCQEHSDSCLVEGCPYNTCYGEHHCNLCATCGLCACTENCGCTHETCGIGEDAALRVRVNSHWYGWHLQNAAGSQDAQWVYVPVDITKLNQNATNYIQLASNLENEGNQSSHSVDVYFTAGEAQNGSFLTDDRYCDGNWVGYSDRRINMMLQFFYGTQWISAVEEEYDTGMSSVVGKYIPDSRWYHYARNIDLGELADYSAARVAIQVHIGEGAKVVSDYDATGFASFLSTTLTNTPPVVGGDQAVVVHTVAPAAPAEGKQVSERKEPVLQLRVNGNWHEKSLKDMATNETGIAWTTVEIPIEQLNSGDFNQVVVSSNVKNGAKYSCNSVELFATSVENGESFLNVNRYYDDWTLYSGYQWNMYLEVSEDGSNWVSLNGTAPVYYDAAVTMGITNQGEGSYAARNFTIGDIGGYSYARVRMQLHIGDQLRVYVDNSGSISHNDKPPVEAPATSQQDSADASLRVRVNGTWFETALQEYKGSQTVWVPVEIDLNLLRADAENYFSVSTNVANYGSFTGNTVDIFCTASNEVNSFITPDQYCDNDYALFSNQNVNLRLELFDGENWIAATPIEKTYYDGSVVLGYDRDNGVWSSVARNLMVGNLSGYTKARVMVQVHVGNQLETMLFQGAEPDGTQKEEDSFDRDVPIELPSHNPEDSKTEKNAGLKWIWIVLPLVACVVLVPVVVLVIGKKSKKT